MGMGGRECEVDIAGYGTLPEEQQRSCLDTLAARAAAGNSQDLDTLLALVDHYRLSRTAVRRLIVNDADAEDVYQDVLMRLSQSIESFAGDSQFTTWLYTVARNAAIDHLRRQRKVDPLNEDRFLSAAERISSLVSTRTDVQAVLIGLPNHYRSVVTLRDLEGKTYAEIAEELEIPINTVRSRLARGRSMIARELDQL